MTIRYTTVRDLESFQDIQNMIAASEDCEAFSELSHNRPVRVGISPGVVREFWTLSSYAKFKGTTADAIRAVVRASGAELAEPFEGIVE